jgi:hypothetical protein
MLTWKEFSEVRPDLAEAARSLYYQFGGVGLGMLGTVRKDGGPRMHPMCPVITDDGLYAFIEPGPKRYDLDRDGRYALHCHPPDKNEDAAYITGRAERRDDLELLERVHAQFWSERPHVPNPPPADVAYFYEFLIEACMITRTTGFGDFNPQHTIWRAD